MTVKAQTYVLVKVVGNIDSDFGHWQAGVLERVRREMELQFGSAVEVTKAGHFAHAVDVSDSFRREVVHDANGRPMYLGEGWQEKKDSSDRSVVSNPVRPNWWLED